MSAAARRRRMLTTRVQFYRSTKITGFLLLRFLASSSYLALLIRCFFTKLRVVPSGRSACIHAEIAVDRRTINRSNCNLQDSLATFYPPGKRRIDPFPHSTSTAAAIPGILVGKGRCPIHLLQLLPGPHLTVHATPIWPPQSEPKMHYPHRILSRHRAHRPSLSTKLASTAESVAAAFSRPTSSLPQHEE
ncbi:hypothetical protein R3P38DRAFT_3291078 [Favolaschia claudopus]|uniref:Uncharacterized protein n=1 Tax=Favolaschia claudopus TaxID=2862362 RepID=A0AAV9ZQ72_9AGAR